MSEFKIIGDNFGDKRSFVEFVIADLPIRYTYCGWIECYDAELSTYVLLKYGKALNIRQLVELSSWFTNKT